MNLRYQCLVLVAVLAVAVCRADTVYLTDGSEINGTVIEEDGKTVVVKRPNGSVQSLRRADVDVIVYEAKPAAPAKKAGQPAAAPATPTKAETAQPKAAEAKTPTADVKGRAEQPKEAGGTAKTAEGVAAKDDTARKEGEAVAAKPEKKETAAGEAEKKEGATATEKKEGDAATEKKDGDAAA
ncbi:MAG: hypothetical protein NTW87_23845, partial [Planctomycetota bacterium]|nr:hypothetical protein [Planctomycetota bacterium]